MADTVIEHSLDELPSFNMEEVVPETQVIHETIETQSLGNDEVQAITSLLAAKSSYEQVTTYPSLIPVIKLPSITDMIQNHDMFFGGMRQEAVLENFLEIPIDSKIVGLKGKEIRTLRKARLTGITQEFAGNISATFNADTVIKSPDGTMVDSDALMVGSAPEAIKTKGKEFNNSGKKKVGNMRKGFAEDTARVFEFGTPGKHLIFSQPVKVEIETPTITDGNEIELGVLHE
jgi:hypothetical protein